MDFIKESEKVLSHYKDNLRSLEWQEKQIQRLKWAGAPDDITGINLDGLPKGSNAEGMMNLAFELKAYIDMKTATEEEIKDVDKILNEMSKDSGCELYGEMLRSWYIEGIPKEKILEEFSYSSLTSIYELKGKAIKKLAVCLFGSKARKAI